MPSNVPFSVQFRLVKREGIGIKQVPIILAQELQSTFKGLAKRLTASAATRMNRDTGEEIRSLKSVVERKGMDISLIVYSTLLKAFIDAYGMRPGTRVPYGRGSRIYDWASRKAHYEPQGDRPKRYVKYPAYRGAGPYRKFGGKRGSKAQIKPLSRIRRANNIKVAGNARLQNKNKSVKRLAYLTARAIYDRGLRASHWNKEALEANRGRILRDLKDGIKRAVNRINRGG